MRTDTYCKTKVPRNTIRGQLNAGYATWYKHCIMPFEEWKLLIGLFLRTQCLVLLTTKTESMQEGAWWGCWTLENSRDLDVCWTFCLCFKENYCNDVDNLFHSGHWKIGLKWVKTVCEKVMFLGITKPALTLLMTKVLCTYRVEKAEPFLNKLESCPDLPSVSSPRPPHTSSLGLNPAGAGLWHSIISSIWFFTFVRSRPTSQSISLSPVTSYN